MTTSRWSKPRSSWSRLPGESIATPPSRRPSPTPRSSLPQRRRRPTGSGTRCRTFRARPSDTPGSRWSAMPEVAELPVVVGLGLVDPDLVNPVLGGHCRFVPDPTEADLAQAQGAIVRADARVDTDLLARTPRLRVVARTGVGVERVDLDAATNRGIAVVVTPGAGTAAVAEGAIAMAMHLVKRFGRLTTLVRTGQWSTRGTVPVGDLGGAVLGVVGYGRIGQRAGAVGAALGMSVLAYDPVSEPPADVRCTDLKDLFGRSDVITLHLPLLESTRHLVGRELLGHVKPGAVLVNCGRGGLIDIDAVH